MLINIKKWEHNNKITNIKKIGMSYCKKCPAGSYQELPTKNTCIACDPGSASSVLGSFDHNDCVTCNSGFYAKDAGQDHCEPCPAGQYQPLSGSSSCELCEAGTENTLTKQINSNVCIICSPGYYSPVPGTASCIECEAGTYQKKSKALSCDKCPPGKFSSKTKMTDISTCVECDIGTFAPNSGQGSCNDCPEGTYQDKKGSSKCEPCTDGYYLPFISQSNESKKIPCEPGSYCPSPGAGHSIPCPSGTANNLPLRASINDCIECDYDYFALDQGQLACDPCPPFSESKVKGARICKCLNGYYEDLSMKPNYCLECHEFCDICSITPTNCQKCKPNKGLVLFNSVCYCETTNGFYIVTNPLSKKLECLPCYGLCSSCYGPQFDQCSSCKYNLRNKLVGNQCHCEKGSYFNTLATRNEELCPLCHTFCLECTDYKFCSSCITHPGIMHINGALCQCAHPNYYLEEDPISKKDQCLKCDSLCDTCSGKGNDNCKTCSSTSYSVEKKPNLCVANCLDAGAYYLSGNECKKCHDDCSYCFGSKADNCYTCSDPDKWLLNNRCTNGCPDHYFKYFRDRMCLECDRTCLSCFNATRFGCITCPQQLVFHQFQCLQNCPDKYFETKRQCEPCIEGCLKCKSKDDCDFCQNGYFLTGNPSRCVRDWQCPRKTYPDIGTNKCEDCHKTCATCLGPNPGNCLLCNVAAGYAKLTDDEGECLELSCNEGMYLHLDISTSKASCLHCHPACKSCDGGKNINCFSCNSGYFGQPSTLKNRQYCKSCEDLAIGYINNPNGDGSCVGIKKFFFSFFSIYINYFREMWRRYESWRS